MSVKTMIQMIGVAGTVLLTGMAAFAVSSEPVFVDGDLRSAHWATLFTNTVDLVLDWSAYPDATKACLDISCMNGSASAVNFTKGTAADYSWQVFASEVPEKEDAYTLILTFLAADDAVVGVSTARLAVVRGAFGNVAIDAVPTSETWPKVNKNALIPCDVSFTEDATAAAPVQLVITKQDVRSETNTFEAAVGYYGWKIEGNGWGFGVYDLSLTFAGTADSCDATVVRIPSGTALRVR